MEFSADSQHNANCAEKSRGDGAQEKKPVVLWRKILRFSDKGTLSYGCLGKVFLDVFLFFRKKKKKNSILSSSYTID